jgi:hypothetical protein
MTLDKREFLLYLDEAIALESECYTIEKVLKATSEKHVAYREEPPLPEAPAVVEARGYKTPSPEKDTRRDDERVRTVSKIVLVCATVLLTAAILENMIKNGRLVLSVWLALASLSFLVAIIILIVNIRRLRPEPHVQTLAEWASVQSSLQNFTAREQQKKALERYASVTMPQYKRRLAEVREHNQTAKFQNEIADTVHSMLQEQLQALQGTRNKLYSLDAIYPKYRNLVAVTSFYEYFDSGRCDELEGAQGAYNLFEAEKRTDVIIYQIDAILARLGKIADNQYKLYTEMTRVNENIKVMNAGLTQKLQEISGKQDALAAQADTNAKTLALGIRGLSDYMHRLGEVNARALNYLSARR